MNASLSAAAVDLVNRASARGKSGKTAGKRDMDELIRQLAGRIPDWYVELLTSVPLCGLELGWQAYAPDDDYDGISWMEWCDPRGILSESVECYPGLAILECGYVNVAGDADGGGDPYFIPIDAGVDPPLYQVFHDVSDRAEEILVKGRVLVAKSLSEFFAGAILAD